MDNDDAIVGRIYSRREAITLASRAGFGLVVMGGLGRDALGGLLTAPSPEVHLVASPVLEEGPFFVDEKLNRSNLIGNTTRESVVKGVPLALKLTVFHANGSSFSPMQGAHVDVWHADGHGVYSDESNPMNREVTAHQNWLRGYQVSDPSGVVNFQTIIPGWYEGRTAHIHLKIRRFSATGQKTSEFSTQLFFNDGLMDKVYSVEPYNSRGERRTRNDNDHVYNNAQLDGSVAGKIMTLDLASNATGGYGAHFAIALTKGNENQSGRGDFGRGFGGPWTPPPGGYGPFDSGLPKKG